jgi:hypothetical protein
LEANCTFSVAFTIGHTLALILSVFGIIAVKVNVEFLIPITILITALFNLFTAGKVKKESINLVFFYHFIFWNYPRLRFSNYFKQFWGTPSSKLLPLGEFALESRPLK